MSALRRKLSGQQHPGHWPRSMTAALRAMHAHARLGVPALPARRALLGGRVLLGRPRLATMPLAARGIGDTGLRCVQPSVRNCFAADSDTIVATGRGVDGLSPRSCTPPPAFVEAIDCIMGACARHLYTRLHRPAEQSAPLARRAGAPVPPRLSRVPTSRARNLLDNLPARMLIIDAPTASLEEAPLSRGKSVQIRRRW